MWICAAAASNDNDDNDDDDDVCVCIIDSCAEEGSQLKLTEVTQTPLVKQNLDTNVIASVCIFTNLTDVNL